MSATRKKTLFIALASLLASATGFAVLVTYASTSESTPHTAAEHAGGVSDPFHPPTDESVSYSDIACASLGEGTCQFLSAAGSNEAPDVIDFRVDPSFEENFSTFENYSALSDVVGPAQMAVMHSRLGEMFATSGARLSLGHAQLTSGIPGQTGGASQLSNFNSSMSFGLGGHSSDPPVGGGNTQNGPGSVPGNDSPGSVPGNDSPGSIPGNDSSGSIPGGDSPGSVPGSDSPGSIPGDDAPGFIPGDDSPVGETPITTVPEPGSMGLLAFGLAIAAVMGRRRRRSIRSVL